MGIRALVRARGAACRSSRADNLSPADLARKNEGGYVTGLPLAAYSTDIGFGGGARAYYYWNGDARRSAVRDARRTCSAMFLQVFVSTRGVQFHWLDFDAPKLADSPYRFRSQLIYARNINQNYFGLGDAALAPLRVPRLAQTFDHVRRLRRGAAGGRGRQDVREVRPVRSAASRP